MGCEPSCKYAPNLVQAQRSSARRGWRRRRCVSKRSSRRLRSRSVSKGRSVYLRLQRNRPCLTKPTMCLPTSQPYPLDASPLHPPYPDTVHAPNDWWWHDWRQPSCRGLPRSLQSSLRHTPSHPQDRLKRRPRPRTHPQDRLLKRRPRHRHLHRPRHLHARHHHARHHHACHQTV